MGQEVYPLDLGPFLLFPKDKKNWQRCPQMGISGEHKQSSQADCSLKLMPSGFGQDGRLHSRLTLASISEGFRKACSENVLTCGL